MLSFRRFIQILNAFCVDFPAQATASETGHVRSNLRDVTSVSPGSADEIPVVRVGQEFVTPLGKRRLQVVRFVGGGKRAKVYQAFEPGSRQTYALKVLHERTPVSLQSMALESAKADALASHQLPHARIVETGVTYALKEWIDGIGGDQWLRGWMERGTDPADSAFLALVRFFGAAAAKGVHVNDLKPPNMILRGGTEWVPVDPGLITALVPPAVVMKCYRERFVRRWLRASRSPFWSLIYWTWSRMKNAGAVAPAGEWRAKAKRDQCGRYILNEFAAQCGPKGLCFWGPSLVLSARLQSLLLAVDRPDQPDVEVLKRSPRRSVFRVRTMAPELSSLIVKAFPLAKIESRVKYRKYGLAEFNHYQQAAKWGIPMPACYGYFEVRALGLVKANGVLIEDLAGWRSLADLAQADPARRREILAMAIPLLKQLFETGVNHIDTSPQNMLRSPDGAELRLIDWHYCSFVRPRQAVQLLLQAAHFLGYADLPAGSASSEEWLGDLAAACGWPKPADNLRRAVAALHSRGRTSTATRLALSPDPAVLTMLELA